MKWEVAPLAAKRFPGLKAHKLVELQAGGNLIPPQCYIVWGEYQVGLLEGFLDSDPIIQNEDGAKWLAQKLSRDEDKLNQYYPVAYGVWDNRTGLLLAIYYCGDGYS